MSDRSNVLRIQTPEGIEFPLVLAGPISRFLAWLLDVLCIFAAATMMGWITGAISVLSGDVAYAVAVLSYFVISIGYPMAAEWYWRGQTLGKRLLGLRVVDSLGLRLQFSQVAVRNLLRFVDSLPLFYVVGGITCLLSRYAQRLGDVAGNTIVIRVPRVSEPDLVQALSGKYNSFRDYPHLAARLHQRITPREAGVALQALLRREELDPVARVELFEAVAAHMKRIVDFPPEAVEGLTDEQYVRNIVDILFRR